MLNLRLREQMREAVVSQAELQGGPLAGTQPITVGFVDIVGFTRLGEDVEPEGPRSSCQEIERAVADAVEPPVRLVKIIGDAAMLVAPQPGPVVDTVVRLVERSNEQAPLLRGGVACGEGLTRAGDWYGRPVNLAARLTGFARRGSVVTSKEVRRRHRRRLRLVDRRQQALQGRARDSRRIPGAAAPELGVRRLGLGTVANARGRAQVSALSVFSQVKS